jgi:hypothetical protein
MGSTGHFDGLMDENWEIATGAVVVVVAWLSVLDASAGAPSSDTIRG